MYVMKYRKPSQWFFRSLRLQSHQYVAEHDKMVFTLNDGSIYEMPSASQCDIRLPKASVDKLNEMRAKANGNVSNTQGPDHE